MLNKSIVAAEGGLQRMSVPADEFYDEQWHLNGTWGINVESVWDSWTGAGVTVADFDDGIQDTHPDLAANYSHALDFNAETGGGSGLPIHQADNHGTAVAGLIAAARDDTVGTVGVAYDATLVSIYQDFEGSNNADVLADGFAYAGNTVDVMNNSWGFPDPYFDNFHGAFSPEGSAISTAAVSGRDGLGTIILFSAGNEGDLGVDTNYHNFTNSRFVITVGATDFDGQPLFYTTPGSSVLVSAPGDGIWTTDRVGSAGYNVVPGGSDDDTSPDLNYTNSFGGTSAAAPIVAGVVALMLEANPDLGWRDVQEILAYSARQTADTGSYDFNEAGNWNGGGLHFSYLSGAGLVDAHAAVRLAETWSPQRTSADEQVLTDVEGSFFLADFTSHTVFLSIPSGLVIERVDLDVFNPSFAQGGHSWTGDLRFRLTSPSGTEGLFVPGDAPWFVDGPEPHYEGTWTYDSVQFMGEASGGQWTLAISDMFDDFPNDNGQGILGPFTLRVYGHASSANDVYTYTDEFSEMFGQDSPGRGTLSDGDGGVDTLNAAAVTGSVTIDLGGGSSSIDGHSLSITSNTIEDVFAGDGNDLINGSSVANDLDGGRGNDRMFGRNGEDVLNGNLGGDTLSGENGNDVLLGDALTDLEGAVDTLYGGASNDFLTGGGGSDRMYGDDNDDWLEGASGNDTLYGGNGNDVLSGADDNDFLYGGLGVDVIRGGNANDVAYGGADGDWIEGGASNDNLFGDEAADTLLMGAGRDNAYGGNGDDVLDGAAGNDHAFGGDGDDVISGGPGDDVCEGGAGNDLLDGGIDGASDVFVFGALAAGQDTILDFERGPDLLDFSQFDFNDFAGFQTLGGVLGTIDASGFQLVGFGDVLALVHTTDGSPIGADDFLF